jgi:dihydrodipicolinate synthase/N-acetylneuraminate lyase
MSEQDWRGIFAIPMTPYDEQDRVDEEVLAAEIEFCIESKVGGIVVPVMVSEFWLLSEEERRTLIRVPVEVSRGRTPIVANVAAVNTPLAVSFAEYAQKVGADAVIAMPPYIQKPDFDTMYDYFAAINEVVDVPIWIQNAGMAPMSGEQIVKVCTEIEHVSWVKEEVPPAHKSIAALVGRKSPGVHGVMGGGGGRNLITEWERGAAGCVPACEFCDVLQRIHDLLDEGQMDEAGDLFEKILPAVVLEGLLGMAYAKEIMIRRGVFKNNRIRSAAKPLDAHDMWEIDRVWERLQPYLIWHKS